MAKAVPAFIRVGEDMMQVVHRFSDMRAIVNMEGVYVLVDRVSPTEWELSGEPARPGTELETLNALVKALENEGTTVTVVKS